jgi:Spy/CpxP family protein refolding chaperone
VNRTIRLTVAAFALSCASADAGLMGPGRRGPDFLRHLFPPSLIMQHQSDIGLTDAQRQAITKAITEAEKDTLDVRWQLEEKTGALTKLLAAGSVDEAAALAQADEVLELEGRMKRLRLGLMIRVKNVLTPAQQETLRRLAPNDRRERWGPRGDDAPGREGREP